MNQEDIEKLVEILANRAEAQDGYLKSLAERANLPSQWRGEISWHGASRQDARTLIEEAWSRGDNKSDLRFSSLGSILHIVWKEDVGPDKGVEIAILIVRYNLYKDEGLLRELKANRDLLKQLDEIYHLQDFEVFNTAKSKSSDILISEQAKDGLVKILRKIISNNEENYGLSAIKDACRKALPKSTRHRALSINKIEQVLNLLDQYPSARDRMPRIIQFASHLSSEMQIDEDEYIASDDNLISEIHQDINTWFRINAFENSSVSRDESLPFPEPRLFIVVKESLTGGRLGSSNQEQFSVQAWFIPNFPCFMPNRETAEKIYETDEYYALDLSYLFSIYQDEILERISSDLLKKIKETEFDGLLHITNLALSLGELKDLLSLFLSEALFLITEEDPNNEKFAINSLSIELFLPEKLLCSIDVDKWVVFNLVNGTDHSPVGAAFKVLLHNLARFTKRQAKKNRIEAKKAKAFSTSQENPWKVNWRFAMDKLQDSPSSDEFVPIKTDSDLDMNFLQSKLEGRIGVVLGQTPQRAELLKAIIANAGIPIVLWTRYEGLDVDHSSEMQELACAMRLIDLPARVFNKRREAMANKQPVNHLGHHVAVLWDDPNRFPPSEKNLK